MPSELLTDRRGAVLVLTLCDAVSLNSLSQQLVAAFAEALDIAEGDPEVRCIVVRGDGANFCSGAGAPAQDDDPQPGATPLLQDALSELIESLRVFPKPVLAAVEGLAAESGLALALGCDLIVAAQDARFVVCADCAGGTPDDRVLAQLGLRLPTPLLQQLAWLPGQASAQRLHQLGVVGWVSETGQALEQALGIADRLAAVSQQTLASAKERVQKAGARSRREPPKARSRQMPLGLDEPSQQS